ncbi:MAG: hypothetical protein AAGE94_11960 [Acidobacteriota bacterium]
MRPLHCRVTSTADESPAIDEWVDLGPTPGDVGIALSGGGSRAMLSGMGQLRALRHLQLDGRSLLGSTKAISAVSGGAWLAGPFTFLPDGGVSDDAFLNGYVADPGRLVLTATPGHDPAETLDVLPDGNPGRIAASPTFSVTALAIEAVLLSVLGVAPERLWQTLIGLHVLRPYGLFRRHEIHHGGSLFSWDAASLERDVTGPNPSLDRATAYLRATGSERVRRPFFLCDTSIFVDPVEPLDPPIAYLAQVQITPLLAGAFGEPAATDVDGRLVGGGGVTPFALGSRPTAVDAARVTIEQERQLSLTDAVGLSSVAFAEALENAMLAMRESPEQVAEQMRVHWSRMRDLAETEPTRGVLHRALDRAIDTAERLGDIVHGDVLGVIDDLIGRLIPVVRYWPIRDLEPQAVAPNRFADGGNLEDSGVAALLAWRDVRRIMALVNSPTAMTEVAKGLVVDGETVPGTAVEVDSCLPPLFGYQPWTEADGYLPYEGASVARDAAVFRFNQVFPRTAFPDLLRGLTESTDGGRRPALFRQQLDVVDNPWFGVRGGRRVTVLWFNLQPVADWRDALAPDVRALLDTEPFADFPNYPTDESPLSPHQINLLAQLTAWSLGEAGGDLVRDLFAEDPFAEP